MLNIGKIIILIFPFSLQIIAMAYDWTFQGRSEMVRCSLDTLAICSVMPKVQISFCDKIRLYDETNIGIHIILSAAEGEIVQVWNKNVGTLVRGLRVCSL